MNRKYNIKRLLQEGKGINILAVPYGRAILLNLPDDFHLDPHVTAEDAYTSLLEQGADDYLNLSLEEFLLQDEAKRTRSIVRWSFYTGLISSFALLLAIIYVHVKTLEYPSWVLVFFPLLVPAILMWNQAGVLKAEKANSLAKIIRSMPIIGNRNSNNSDIEPDYSYSRSRTTLDEEEEIEEEPVPRKPKRKGSSKNPYL